VAAPMEPKAALPAGDALILDKAKSNAPFSRERLAARSATARSVRVKPLRPAKERFPVATEADPAQLLSTAPAGGQPPSGAAPMAPPTPPAAPPATTPFTGGADNRTTIPPDTAGAVGPTHVFNPLNNNVWSFDRSGQQVRPEVSLEEFWSGEGIAGDMFDPRAIYDPHERRLIFVTMADAGNPTSSLLVAASLTDDPTKEWVSHAIQVDDAAQGSVWLDFPSIGFTSDKITIQVNLFTRAGNQFAGSTVYAIDKRSLYDPPHQALVQRFNLQNQGATHVPAMTYDAGVADQLLLARWSGNIQNQGFLACFRLSGNVATGSANLTRVGFVTVPQTWDAFPSGDLGRQTGSNERLSVGDDRLLSVILRNGKLYACHAVMLPTGNPTRSAVQWWEIDAATFAVRHVGRIDDATGATCFAAPSLAVNRNEDILIGHAQFSANIHGSGAFSLRRAGGALQSPTIFAPGRNTYRKPPAFGGNSNRWGDYSHTQVDPNDLDFWTVQQFADNPADTWATMWTRVAVSAGGPPAPARQIDVRTLAKVGAGVADRIKSLARTPAPKVMAAAPQGVVPLKPVKPGVERWPVKTGVDDDVDRVGTLDFAGVTGEGIVPTTVEELIELPRPEDMSDINGFQSDYQDRRADPVELVIWQLDADITVLKKESDGDLHIVLQGVSGDTMIAEAPNPHPKFVAKSSPWFDAIKEVRRKIADKFGQTFARVAFKPMDAKFAMPAAPVAVVPPGVPAAPLAPAGPGEFIAQPPPGGDIFDALPPFKAQVPRTPVTVTGVGFFDRVHGQTGVALKNGIELHPILAIEFH